MGLPEIYAEVDRLLAGWSCEASTDCCHFGRTGREPYLTPLEWQHLKRALAGRTPKKARLTIVDDEGRCPLLDATGRCSVYADRPFGCRTFFCERAISGGERFPRQQIRERLREVVAENERYNLHGEPRPLRRWLGDT